MARGSGGSNGSEDAFAKAVEIVLTTVVVAAIGFGLDRWLGTGPWLAMSFGMVALVLKLMIEWYRYADIMRAHEADLESRRPAQQRGIDREAGLDEPASLPTGVSLDADADPSA